MSHFLSALLNGALGELGLGALPGYLSDPWSTIRDEFLEPFKEWAEDFIDNTIPSAYRESLERVQDLANGLQAMEDVFNDIGHAINDALDSGETPPQTDGGLGETYDNFSPDGEVPFEVGTLPGFGSGGAGMNRNDTGGGGGSSLPPGGDSGGSSTPSPPPMDTGPSLQDLGVDPSSGAYVEYQPTEGQAVIHYPDGTTETRPWP